MALKLKVLRADLIAAIEAKAKSNQAVYDKAVEDQKASGNIDLVMAINEAIDKSFGKNALNTAYNAISYTKANAVQAKSNLLQYLGITEKSSLAAPILYTRQLAALKMAQGDTLEIDDTNDYFSFLA